MDKQLRASQDIGGTIQQIDFENLRVQNYEFQAGIDDHNEQLKTLKFINAEWHTKLERNKVQLARLMEKRTNVGTDIAIVSLLLLHVQKSRFHFNDLYA